MNNYPNEVKFLVAGEYGLVIEFGTTISPEINRLVQQMTRLINGKAINGVLDVVPTYRSVTVYFDPLCITRQELSCQMRQILNELKPLESGRISSRVVDIPVCYGGVLGPDLEFVARHTGLSSAEVITMHTSKPYLVYMLGFAPGFTYLGGLPEQLVVPRQEKPRNKVPAGSVGIGGNQTGVYPIESLGEWWLIGRTPLQMFNPQSKQPFLISAGEYLHFVAISIDEYFAIRRAVRAGIYVPQFSQME